MLGVTFQFQLFELFETKITILAILKGVKNFDCVFGNRFILRMNTFFRFSLLFSFINIYLESQTIRNNLHSPRGLRFQGIAN